MEYGLSGNYRKKAMTLRQGYAAAALQGILAAATNYPAETIAGMAFIYADAMLKAERTVRPENFSEQEGDPSDYTR